MPKYNADGTVLGINISSIRVQNWDKTITAIPTYALISEPVKNWQGMEQSNTRRIRRKILIDVNTIGFLNEDQITKLKKVNHLNTYLKKVLNELDEFNTNQK